MSALDQFEYFLKDLMERPAWLLTPRRLQPLQLASAITKELEARALRLSDRVLVPDSYTVAVSDEDWERFGDARPALEQELADYLRRLVRERDLSVRGNPEIRVEVDPNLRSGQVAAHGVFRSAIVGRGGRVGGSEPGGYTPLAAARPVSGLAVARPTSVGPCLAHLAEDGSVSERFPLKTQSVTLGRRSDNDVPLPDVKVSRHHARLDLDGDKAYLTDLDSTNGTRINGQEVRERSLLHAGDTIEIGLQRLRFER